MRACWICPIIRCGLTVRRQKHSRLQPSMSKQNGPAAGVTALAKLQKARQLLE
jgi:hypothetical protein